MNSHEFERGQDGNRGKGGKILGFTGGVGVPKQELPGIDPGIGKVIGPTPQEVEDANAGRLAPKGLTKKVIDLSKKWQFRLGLLAGIATGAAAYGAYENIPAVHRLIDERNPGKLPIEEKFPDVIDKSSFTPVSEEEIQNLWDNTEVGDLKNFKLNLVFPVDKQAIDQSEAVRYKTYFDTDTILPPYIDKKEIENRGTKNLFVITGLPKNTIVYSPINGDIEAIQTAGLRVGSEGTSNSYIPAYSTSRISSRDKDGKVFMITLSVLWGKPLIDIPPFGKTSIKVNAGQPLFQLTRGLQDKDSEGVASPGEDGQITIRAIYDQQEPRAPIPLTPNSIHNSTGSIVVPENKK